MKTLDITECAQYLKISKKTAFELALAGELPGAKVGRSWVFLEDELVLYIRSKTNEQQKERQSRSIQKSPKYERPKADADIDFIASFNYQRRRRNIPPDLSRYTLGEVHRSNEDSPPIPDVVVPDPVTPAVAHEQKKQGKSREIAIVTSAKATKLCTP